MQILESAQFNFERFVLYAQRALYLLLGLSLLFFSALFYQALKQPAFSDTLQTQNPLPASLNFAYETIGTGPLCLHMEQVVGLLTHLSQEVVVLGRNRRPDVNGRQADLLIALKTAQQEQVVAQGQLLFLEWRGKEEGAVLSIAGQKTPLWIKPQILDRNSILIEVGIEREGKEEKGQMILEDAPLENKHREMQTPCFELLQKITCWGKDSLIQFYGGNEYASIRDKYKIFFADETLSYSCFVAPGDYLIWEENKWKVKPLEQQPTPTPIAYVKSVSAKGIEIEAWDERGFFPLHFKFPLQNPVKGGIKADNFLSSARLRNASQVSCVLGKRRMLLKPGDWLLKTSSGWHNLRRFEEIEECLQHKVRGELFIFDSIEKEQGKSYLKGRLFDEMRTQVEEISLGVAAEKKKERPPKKQPHRLPKEGTHRVQKGGVVTPKIP